MKFLFLWMMVFGCGVEHQLDKGRDAIEKRDLVEAEISFRKALNSEPSNTEALYGLGWTYYLAAKNDEAREMFKRCIDTDPRSHLGYKGLGSVAMIEGNLGTAEESYLKALNLAPSDSAVLNSLGLLYLRQEENLKALEIYEKVKGEPALAVGHSEALMRLERLDEARQVVEEAIKTPGPKSTEALLHQTRARILLRISAGRLDSSTCASAEALLAWLDEAEQSLEKAAKLQPDLPELFSIRKTVHQRKRQIQNLCPN